jgi:hypothetical protein
MARVNPLMKFFEFEHLSDDLKPISEPFHKLAHDMNNNLPDSSEKSVGLRKLLEAKDCMVRAAL